MTLFIMLLLSTAAVVLFVKLSKANTKIAAKIIIKKTFPVTSIIIIYTTAVLRDNIVFTVTTVYS
jgi:hypothetical protein